MGSKLDSTQPIQALWSSMFKMSRSQSCAASRLKNKILGKLKSILSVQRGVKAKKGKFWWVKNWGYGQSAYIFDYLDPVLGSTIVSEFQRIYNHTMALNSKSDNNYTDPFSFDNFLSNDMSKSMANKLKQNLKKMNDNYEPKIYQRSANAVQIHNALRKFKWAIDFGLRDYATNFIKNFDINGDGRMNPRELILGSIEHNKHLFGSHQCNHCYEGVVPIIDAMFIYMDCDNNGVITAEDLWNHLPNLVRKDQRFNIFALADDAGIRTASVNDFILKNMRSRNGQLTKAEFRNAILFGYWDRQTAFDKILLDDSRTLKKLRWTDEDMVDIAAEKYIAQKMGIKGTIR